jgi:hypothetical protein
MQVISITKRKNNLVCIISWLWIEKQNSVNKTRIAKEIINGNGHKASRKALRSEITVVKQVIW